MENMSPAIDAYISRVDGCPCGESTIHLYHVADSTEQQQVQEKLLVFLKGFKVNREALCNFITNFSWFGRLEKTIYGTWSTILCFRPPMLL